MAWKVDDVRYLGTTYQVGTLRSRGRLQAVQARIHDAVFISVAATFSPDFVLAEMLRRWSCYHCASHFAPSRVSRGRIEDAGTLIAANEAAWLTNWRNLTTLT